MARPQPADEPRLPLSQPRVLDAAVALADRDGIESLSMRKLADALGVGAMSLYYYVPNKDELLDGMIELVFGEIELPSLDDEWRAAMRQRAVSTRQTLGRHRWAVGLMESRRTPGPASLRVHDTVLGILREAGFSIEMTIHALSVQDAYIYGFALQEKSVPFEGPEEVAAVAREQVREFAELADSRDFGPLAEEFPYLAEVVGGHVASGAFDFGDEFEYGLDLILDALEQRRDPPD